MERNLRLYPVYQACGSLLFWLPVFFLYLSSRVSLEEVLLLEGIYYLGVVVLEVPSGYFSDRVGRRPTLLISTCGTMLAAVLFAGSSSFWPFALAQILLAVGMAFNSGTDTSLLYDSLAALDRGEEIGRQEARAYTAHYIALAAAALVGGLAAGFDLRIPYLLSAAGALGALLVAWRFVEPPHRMESAEAALAPHRQLGACLRRLEDPVLRWIFVFAVGMTIFNHVPHEFFQPYLDFLLGGAREAGYQSTPAASGVLVAATMLVSALASSQAMRLRRLLGTPGALLASMVLVGTIMAAMAAVIHPVVLVLILFRTVPRAVLTPISNAAIHPRLERGIRATYLSMQSLAGRLAFSMSLFLSSLAVSGTERITPPVLSGLLWAFTALLVLLLAGLAATARPVARATSRETRP